MVRHSTSTSYDLEVSYTYVEESIDELMTLIKEIETKMSRGGRQKCPNHIDKNV